MPNHVTCHLQPGGLYASADGGVVRTVVGSCVAVTLWDRRLGQGGVNHFIYAQAGPGDPRTPSFGDVAIPRLLEMMAKIGSEAADLEASLFGGARLRQSERSNGGRQNVDIARELLRHNRISVAREDVGGALGRRVIFDTRTGEATVVMVRSLYAAA